MEFLDGLVALLERVAAYLVIPVELLLVALILLALPLLITLLQQARQLKRSREWREELAQLLREGQRQHTRTDKTLAALQQNQTRIAEALLRLAESGQLQEEIRRQFTQTLSVLADNLATLAQKLEVTAPKPATQASLEQAHESFIAGLSPEPEARIAALEQYKELLLFTAIRDSNREIAWARSAQSAVNTVTQEPPAQAIVHMVPEPELLIPAEAVDQPSDAPDTVSPADFAGVLPEDYERDLLRLIFREDGRPDGDSIRLVLGERFYHFVLDEINERAHNILDDVLLYPEADRHVVTEEFVDDLKTFLNFRAIPSRRV